jgi:hypothetical protein
MLAWAVLGQAATGAFDLSWNACAPVVKDVTVTGGEKLSLYASVIGFDMPNIGYQVQLEYANAAQTVPDAWRFDPAGCAWPFGSVDHLAPNAVAKACPSLQGNQASLQSKGISLIPPESQNGNPGTNMQVFLFNYYPAGVSSVDPGRRYFLMRVEFDLTYSVTGVGSAGESCGGAEESLCFKLKRASYRGLGDVEIPFGRPPGTMTVTVNGAAGCTGPTPAAARTWGRLKDQYR